MTGCMASTIEGWYSSDAMARQLNIKSEEAYRLASELAALKGESLTQAVTAALRERLARERQRATRDERLARILEHAAVVRANVAPGTSSESDKDLYNEDGLPT
jgi:antitoxin VapB